MDAEKIAKNDSLTARSMNSNELRTSTRPSQRFGIQEPYRQEEPRGFFRRFCTSFTADPSAHATPAGAVKADGGVFDPENPASLADGGNTAPLQKELKKRHLQMIAIGGCIGTGLFIGSGKALAVGGPANVLLAFSFVGAMLFCTIQALGEMAVLFPVAGSFAAYSTRFLDPAWGFAMGWNYAMQWLIVLPLEIVAACITINFWDTDHHINRAIFVAAFLVLITVINMFGVKGYGEAEFVFSLIKVVAVVGFIIFGIISSCGGVPGHDYIGGLYWTDPGAFNNGFKGFCSVLVTAAFSFAGTELIGLTAAETANPRKSLPSAVKQVFYRILIFYVLTLLIVGLLVPYNDVHLSLEGSANAAASPFVIAIKRAGITALPSVFNAVIMIAVISVGNSSVYGSSRTLAALADQGQAPKYFGYIDRRGRPVWGLLLSAALGFLAFVVVSGKSGAVLEWMLALSGLSTIFTWGSICLAHIRMRKAWTRQGGDLEELAFRAQFGVFGSYLGFAAAILILAAQFWTSAWPVGYEHVNQAERFFLGFLAVPVVLVFYLSHKIWKKQGIVKISEMDLVTGRRELDSQALKDAEKAEYNALPMYKKWGAWFC